MACGESRIRTLGRHIRGVEALKKSLTHDLARTRATLVENIEAQIADLDRPLRRRRHRVELSAALQASSLYRRPRGRSGRLASIGAQLPPLQAELAEARADADRIAGLETQRHDIGAVLDADAALRAADMANDPFVLIDERLGPRPGDAPRAALWDQAAGRLAQHLAAFGSFVHQLSTLESLVLDRGPSRPAGWRRRSRATS